MARSERTGYEHHCTALEDEVNRLVRLLVEPEPHTPVPSCPDWTLADLAVHVGTAHRWVEHVLRTGARSRIRSREVPVVPPERASELPGWLESGAESLLAVLRSTEPDRPVWTVGADQHARCWARRMLFEAVVHRADVELALGDNPRVETAVALDGVAEFLDNAQCFSWIAERVRRPELLGRTVVLSPNGSEPGWAVELGEHGFDHVQATDPGDVTVRAPAEALLLLLYGRLRPDTRGTVTGDRQLLERWLAACAF